MTENGAPQWEQVEIAGERFVWRIEDGFVQVRLPFKVDLEKLAKHLKEDGYYLSGDTEETGAQGWGTDFDEEDYYPYWVMPDDEQPDWTLFTCPAEDYEQGESPTDTATAAGGAERQDTAIPEYRPYLGALAREELTRWLGHLKQARP